jgi:hypothetical protein
MDCFSSGSKGTVRVEGTWPAQEIRSWFMKILSVRSRRRFSSTPYLP